MYQNCEKFGGDILSSWCIPYLIMCSQDAEPGQMFHHSRASESADTYYGIHNSSNDNFLGSRFVKCSGIDTKETT